MAQKAVVKIPNMTDDKSKQQAVHAACSVYGVDSVEADMNAQTLTVIGTMDVAALVKKLRTKVGKVDVESVEPAA